MGPLLLLYKICWLLTPSLDAYVPWTRAELLNQRLGQLAVFLRNRCDHWRCHPRPHLRLLLLEAVSHLHVGNLCLEYYLLRYFFQVQSLKLWGLFFYYVRLWIFLRKCLAPNKHDSCSRPGQTSHRKKSCLDYRWYHWCFWQHWGRHWLGDPWSYNQSLRLVLGLHSDNFISNCCEFGAA